MPFKSKKQRNYLYATLPRIAKKFSEHTKNSKIKSSKKSTKKRKMEWYEFPHLPEKGDHILAKYQKSEKLFEIVVLEEDKIGPIERWCYFEDYEKLKEYK